MSSYLLVGLGSALGGMARLAATGLAARVFGIAFPWGTLLVNVSGSLAIGLLAALLIRPGEPPDPLRYLAIAGFLGGYTTFSAFSLETLGLAQNGAWAAASAYVGASVMLCLAAVALGYFTARWTL